MLAGLLHDIVKERVPIHPQSQRTYAKLASHIPVEVTFFDKED